VQDLAAQRAAPLLDAQDGMRVLDACAAPGGKTAHILERVEVELTALDSDAARLRRVEENLQRLRLKAHVACGDAAETATWWDGVPYQRILADVPCSASGVVRRHPDIKWLRRAADIAQFAAQQARILDALWQCLDGDGKLLYVTCSVFAEENHRQVDAFLERHHDAELQPLNAGGQLLPDNLHDGFFYALLRKV
ncbi:MAG: 16S rRNA (cytosine(967)-C(5))-methyltransferase RsmB, partial [Burkholderiales bacterium]